MANSDRSRTEPDAPLGSGGHREGPAAEAAGVSTGGVWARLLGAAALAGVGILFGCGGAAGAGGAAEASPAARDAAAGPGGETSASSTASGLVVVESDAPFSQVVASAEEAIVGRGLSLMARIDHQANAAQAGLALRPTTVFIFGKPQAGTPLMVDAPTMALDLPQRMLVVARDDGETVAVVYNDPVHLARRHGIDPEDPRVAGIRDVLEGIAGAAAAGD